MNTWHKVAFVLTTLLFTATSSLQATTNEVHHPQPSLIPIFTNNPTALYVITNLMDAPRPPLSVPNMSHTNNSPSGTYWMLSTPAPLPFDPYPDLPVYQVSTNSGTNYGPAFIIDDRSVDYGSMTNDPPPTFTANFIEIDTNALWLEVATNAIDSNQFNVWIHETTNGDFYDVLTKTDLLLPTWTVENTVTGTVGNVTPVTLFQNGRTNLFIWARTAAISITTQPLSQEVLAGDTVTFTVGAGGVGLTYQWTLNGTNIYGATGSSYTINILDPSQAGDYACIVTGAAGSATSQTATLTVDDGNGDPNQMTTIGQRQDYVFRSGVTYYIGSPVQLFGNTIFEAGTIIKFDYTQLYPCLQVLGTVTSKGVPYNPSILTTIDDDAFGEQWSYGAPQPYFTGVPFLDLSGADSLSITNLRFRYADAAVSTPTGGQLDVWDGQFYQCNAAILNEYNGVDSLHNVLFAGCQEAVAADTNSFAIKAEHITADVSNLWTGAVAPSYVGLTNSIILGSFSGSYSQATSINPDSSNFQTNGAGNYYLAANSTLHQSGTTNISPYLLNEFRAKTTYQPIALPTSMALSGSLTLLPQAARYTNGAPDLGYYYDALDYTVAAMTNFGSITIEPGTAIGFREDLSVYSYWGFDLREESSFVGHGTPNKPIVFTDVQWVQEQLANPCFGLFVPDFQGATTASGPVIDFRFCNFYPATSWYHVWAGNRETGDYLASYNSVVNWTMRDCNLHGGKISLGEPDSGDFYGIPYTTFYGSGAVAWNNNLFENTLVNLQPTFDYYDGTINVDLAFQASNNLFRNSSGFLLVPVPATAGNWTFADNLFDKVNFYQDADLPLDFDCNGYWPLTALELQSGYTSQLQATTTGDDTTNALHEVVLSYAPPYRHSAFGDYYLSTMTDLYEAGSRTAADAGLTQYTTFTIQAKDSANQPVNIGLHYIAATNCVPLDTDDDGIPDYVEDANGNGIVDANETDLNNPMSDGMTPDAYNEVYDDIDLSGNGLVGRVKAALDIDPLDPNNPLTLTQKIFGGEPDVTTFEIPIGYTALTNVGSFHLLINGVPATLDNMAPADDGNTLLVWSAAYEPAQKQYYMQPQFELNYAGNDTSILHGSGVALPFYYNNNLQFFQSDGFFDTNGAYLDAQLPVPNASYVINISDPSTTPPTLLYSITNSTSNGMIQENWNATYADNVTPFAGDNVNVSYDVTLTDPNTGAPITQAPHIRPMPQANAIEHIGDHDGFDFCYMYTPPNNSMLHEFNDDNGGDDGVVWLGLQSVVDTLLSPLTVDGVGSSYFYTSGFNHYTSQGNNNHGNGTSEGFPGYLGSTYDITNQVNGLFLDMTNGLTRNFFCYAHGNNGIMACYSPSNQTASVSIDAGQVARLLQNNVSNANRTNGTLATVTPHTPYRFVFMDGCSTASGWWWRAAFAIYPLYAANTAAKYKIGEQAYVGWEKTFSAWLNHADDSDDSLNLSYAYTETLDNFYDEWMNQVPLAQCIADASRPNIPNTAPFPVPQNGKTIRFKGISVFSGESYDLIDTDVESSRIFVIGHSGLTRSSVQTAFDNQYVAPMNMQ